MPTFDESLDQQSWVFLQSFFSLTLKSVLGPPPEVPLHPDYCSELQGFQFFKILPGQKSSNNSLNFSCHGIIYFFVVSVFDFMNEICFITNGEVIVWTKFSSWSHNLLIVNWLQFGWIYQVWGTHPVVRQGPMQQFLLSLLPCFFLLEFDQFWFTIQNS